MFKTGLEPLVKTARVPMAPRMPSFGAHPLSPARGGTMSTPAARSLQAPAPQSMVYAHGAQPQPGAGGGPPAPVAPTPGGGGGGPSRFRRTLGLAGLGAAGTLAYGMHNQNEEDRRRNSLVYAPLPGSMMQ